MKDICLRDWQWVAIIQYANYPDSKLHIAGTDAPDILYALAKVQSHAKECWPYEIISLKQEEYKPHLPERIVAGD